MADVNEYSGDDGHSPDILTSRKASSEASYRPGEAAVVEWIESLHADAEQAKRDQCAPETWNDDLDTYWGEQWRGSIPTYKPRIVINEIQSLSLQELSDLTDSRLRIFVQKSAATLERDVEVEHVLSAFWTNTFADLTVLAGALDAFVFPLGFFQTGWDPRAEHGQGQVIFRHRDPRTVYPDADAESDDDLRYIGFEDVLDLVQIRRDWPETGWLVEPEGGVSERADDAARGVPGPRSGQYVGPLYTHTSFGGVPGWKKARARVKTYTIDDDELTEELVEAEGSLRARVVPRYPHRRLVQIANRRVLYDDDCPYHGAPFLTRIALQPTIHAYWPRQSIAGAYAETQSAANKLDSLVAENGLRLNAGEVFADADSGITPRNYGGIPGMVYLKKPGSKVEKVYPPPMPPDMIQAGERLRGFIRTEMGYPVARTGAGTRGNVSAELTETEISQSMGITRMRGRLLYQAVQQAVRMIFARMGQFYTLPRHVPYIEDGQWKSARWEPMPKPSDYATHVDPASFQIRSKTMMQRLALALARLGKLPTGRLLQALEWPDAEKVAAEMKEELMLMAAARMRQRQGRGGRAV